MAERDKVIKSGQLTLPRILFLAVIGGAIVFTVYAGGVFLAIGYWLLTIAICLLLFLIAIDYGVKMDKVELVGHTPQSETGVEPISALAEPKTTMGGPRPKRRPSRPVKRRR